MSASISPTRSIETLAPFRRSPESQAGIPAKIDGKIPDWLRGEVVRTCPAVFATGDWRAQHWFDALGMIYVFRIGASTVDFRSRLLDSEAARDAWRGKANLVPSARRPRVLACEESSSRSRASPTTPTSTS